MIADAPRHLKLEADLDAVTIEVSAYQRLMQESTRRRLRAIALVTALIAAPFFLVLSAYGADEASVACGLVAFVAWMVYLLLDDTRMHGRSAYTLVVGAQRVTVQGGLLLESFALRDLVWARATEALQPCLLIRLRDREPFQVPMENEPAEHVNWIAGFLEQRAREARLDGGSAAIPDALRNIRQA